MAQGTNTQVNFPICLVVRFLPLSGKFSGISSFFFAFYLCMISQEDLKKELIKRKQEVDLEKAKSRRELDLKNESTLKKKRSLTTEKDPHVSKPRPVLADLLGRPKDEPMVSFQWGEL